MALFLTIFIGGVVALIFPLWPRVEFALKKVDPDTIDYQISLPNSYPVTDIQSSDDAKPIPAENRLIIPKIAVDSEIIDGATLDVLNVYEGVWRESGNITPQAEGNMVIAGHRFQYAPPNTNTFYNLEELIEGDKIVVFWEGKMFIYEIYSTFEVTPDEVGVRDFNSDVPYEITLYTCTPLYTSDKRFVVKAKLIS